MSLYGWYRFACAAFSFVVSTQGSAEGYRNGPFMRMERPFMVFDLLKSFPFQLFFGALSLCSVESCHFPKG